MSLPHIPIPEGDVVRARRDPESTYRSEPRLKASMSVQPGETIAVAVSHNLPTHDRVLLEPKKTTALGIYTALTDDATGHVVVHNPGTRVVAIQQNQQVGRFRSMDPEAMVYAVDVAEQPSASDLALVTEDHEEKHLLLSDQVIQEENTTIRSTSGDETQLHTMTRATRKSGGR
ncbi:hypothetical protein E4U09_003407 [Claviceps aff. purpurea]|uniref:Uncharacterized protein n=1 Tax=Claviceps aff. purpurea TaxID=1967640 RepID=A0A9P7QH57_9HYPO|nr:hypothetical protein E4U09_003407 [Claviceps aff. purpurea]